MAKPIVYPNADYRPLGKQTQPKLDNPRIIIFHTMVGYLNGTDSMFKQGGYTGDESHFGVGGSHDPAGLDGVVYQWQDLGYTADAQWAGNGYGISIETSDGGDPSHPWSSNQLTSLINLGAWLCDKFGIPARLVTAVSDSGIGYHEQFPEWNDNGHVCPGSVREGQLKSVVIPGINAQLGGDLLMDSEVKGRFDALDAAVKKLSDAEAGRYDIEQHGYLDPTQVKFQGQDQLSAKLDQVIALLTPATPSDVAAAKK